MSSSLNALIVTRVVSERISPSVLSPLELVGEFAADFGPMRQTAVVTSCFRPASKRSIRSASAGLTGLPRICRSTTTIVSAPRTRSVGRCLKMAQAFSRARRSAKILGASPSNGVSGILVGCTVIAMPAARSNSWRRGEAEASTRAIDRILAEFRELSRRPARFDFQRNRKYDNAHAWDVFRFDGFD